MNAQTIAVDGVRWRNQSTQRFQLYSIDIGSDCNTYDCRYLYISLEEANNVWFELKGKLRNNVLRNMQCTYRQRN